MNADPNAYWCNEMPDDVKHTVEESLRQADAGEVLTHDQVKELYPNWFTHR